MKRLLVVVLVLAIVVAVLFVPMEAGRTRIVTSAEIARPPAAVFAYVTTPGHWPEWHPSSLAVSGATDHSLQLGESVVEDFQVAGRRGRVDWRVVAREPDRLWRIAGRIGDRDAGVVGYTLSATASGTRFERTFEYRSPNLLFAILNALSLRGRVEAESAQAVSQLKAKLEQADTGAAPRPPA